MINRSGAIKIADFGISKFMSTNKEEGFNKVGGTKLFQPPELFSPSKGEIKGKPIDIWALGVSFFFLAFGYYPFFTLDVKNFPNEVLNSNPKYPKTGIDADFIDLIKQCLIKDPELRITLMNILSHPWVTKGGIEPLGRHVAPKITVTETEILNAIKPKTIEVNFFALSKLKAKLTHTRTQIQQGIRNT